MKKITLTLLGAIICISFGLAQEGIVKTSYTKDSVITFRVFDTKIKKIDASKSKEAIKDLVKAGKDDDLAEHQSQPDELGYKHYFYQQTYKGINVENGMYIAHIKDGLVENVNGDFLNVGAVDVNATLSESEALAKALESIGAKTYKWQIKEEEQFIKELKNDKNATYYPKGEKVIAYSNVTKTYRLAFKFNIYAHYPLSRNNVYIDAITGELMGKQNLIFDTNATGSADTRYSGNQSITADLNSGTYRLRELTNSVRIETYNMRGRTIYSGAPDFTDGNNSWTAAEYHANLDDAALDAHWGAERVYAYWNSVRGVNSWNGSGSPLLSYVHTDLTNFGYSNNDNAFWDGEKMVYADGQTAFNSVVSLDVVAHEIGHAFCSGVKFMYEPDLNYSILSDQNTPEAIALNEGMSDIWAASVENWAVPAKQCWQVGEEIMRNGFSCLRSLRNPNTEGFRDGFSNEGNYPDIYGGTSWYSGTNLSTFSHVNATVIGHWFFLVSQGSGGNQTNDLGNTFNITGIGITDAASIAWRAERFKFTASTNFASARDLTIQAATELYTANSCQVKAVTDAWYAVGIGSPFQYTNVTLSGPSVVCSSGATYTVDNVPAGCTVSWTCSTNLSFDHQTGNNKTFTATGTGSGTIQAILTSNCGNVTLPAQTVWVGNPASPVIVGNTSLTCNLYLYRVSDNSQVTWTVSGPLRISGTNYGYKCNIIGTGDGYGWIQATATNSCGSTMSEIPVEVICGYYLTFTPNPSNGQTTVSIASADELGSEGLSESAKSVSGTTVFDETAPWDVEVYTQNQLLKDRKTKQIGRSTTINTSDWPEGLYIVKVIYNGDVLTGKLLVKP